MNSSFEEEHSALLKSSLFKDWKKSHPNISLTHFFKLLSSKNESVPWEIGYYNKDSRKITVFVRLQNNEFEIKPEDDVFQKPETQMEFLDLTKVKTDYETASKLYKDNAPTFFPKHQAGDGFVVLQTLDDQTLWSFTFISKTLQFLNIKIDAQKGKIFSHDVIDVVQRE